MLEDLKPLVYDLDDILEDDILNLASVKGLEGRKFNLLSICSILA